MGVNTTWSLNHPHAEQSTGIINNPHLTDGAFVMALKKPIWIKMGQDGGEGVCPCTRTDKNDVTDAATLPA